MMPKKPAIWSAEAFGEGAMRLFRRKKRKSFANSPKRRIVGVVLGCMHAAESKSQTV